MMLAQILQQAAIKVPLEGKDKKAVISELVDLLYENGSLADKNIVLDSILMREQTRSTGIGSGIAIPHGKCNAVRKLVMALGIARRPVDFSSIDGKPVTLVILLVSPSDQSGPHIQALAKISRLIMDEQFRQKLEKAGSAEEAYELIIAKENS